MKLFTNSVYVLVLACCGLLALNACGDENPDPDNNGNGKGDGGGGNDGGVVGECGNSICEGNETCSCSGSDEGSSGDTGGYPDAGADSGSFDSGVDAEPADGGTKDAGSGCAPNCPTGEMVTVPAGKFQMGCNSAVDTECQSDESPYHAVSVPAFKIDKYELTTGEYQACVDTGGCTATSTGGSCNYGVSGRDSHPINCVDWNQATAYCAWAGKRLPTESEWEKAARGTDGRKYPWGNDSLDCDHAVYYGCHNSSTSPVGSKPAGVSPYGAEDMIGNVWEWVEDWYHDTYTGAPSDGSAWVTPTGTYRVLRGGAWYGDFTYFLRASSRNWYNPTPTSAYGNYGFRCALSVQ